MKPRVIKVAMYKVTKLFSPPLVPLPANDPVPNPPEFVPEEAALEAYLNKVYQPQLNATFDVIPVSVPVEVDWDIGKRDGMLDLAPANRHSVEHTAIVTAAGNGPVADLRLFLVGASKSFGGLHAGGYANRAAKTCWVLADPVGGITADYLNHIIAHEIGHILRGYGHPGDGVGPGQLPGVTSKHRLMAASAKPADVGSILVKEEWDEAEKWMKEFVDAPTPPNP